MKDTWYGNGLAFECNACGRCCSGPAEGYVWVNKKEIESLADHLEIPVAQFKKKYVRRVGTRHSLIEEKVTKDCIFLTPTATGKGCQVYPVRPRQCRNWPFWPENLRSQAAWEYAGKKCPGMDQGLYHPTERIEQVLKDKHETAPPPVPVTIAARNWITANRNHTACITAVQELYHALDAQLSGLNPSCENCGRCCDFETFGHRLYATTLEMLVFLHGLEQTGRPTITVPHRRCPYQDSSHCTMHTYRPTGCRIFYCRDMPSAFMSEITEHTLESLRGLHLQFAAVYYYTDLLDWLELLRD